MSVRSSTPRPLLVLAAGVFVLFISGGARFAIGLTLKPMVDEFGAGRSEVGLAVFLFLVVSAALGFVAGRLADRMSLRILLTGGLAFAGVTIGLLSLATSPWQVVLLYGVMFALGNGLTSVPPVSVMVTRAFPARSGFANGVVTAGMSAGQLVMIAILAGVLVTVGWRSVFVWLAVAHLALLPLLFPVIPSAKPVPSHHHREGRSGLDLGQAARTRQFWLLLAIYGICGFDDFFVTTHVVAFAQDRGVDAFLAGNLLAVMGLAALVGVLVAGPWADRSGPVWATAASFAARVLVFVLIVFDQSPISVAIFAFVFGLTFMVTAPLTVLFVRESFGTTHLGALTGLITMVHQVSGGVGALIGARIFDLTGSYDIGFALMLVLSVLALGLTLMLRQPVPGTTFSRPA